jgi:hypothetical protein
LVIIGTAAFACAVDVIPSVRVVGLVFTRLERNKKPGQVPPRRMLGKELSHIAESIVRSNQIQL